MFRIVEKLFINTKILKAILTFEFFLVLIEYLHINIHKYAIKLHYFQKIFLYINISF